MVDLDVSYDGGLPEMTRRVATWFAYETQNFAYYKNLARHIRDIEQHARSMVERLLELNLQRIRRARTSPLSRLKTLRQKRRDIREIAELIASLWLAFARIEAVKRDWSDHRRRLHESIEEHRIESVFVRDQADDEAAVNNMELSFIKAAVEQSATRMDSRTMATITAASAGFALVGALLGAIATALFS